VRAANHAINRLDPLVAIELITGSTARRQRRDILDDLRSRRLDAVAAPRVLDEGIDVPDANLGIVMSASRTRRQMIQRMGRILRRKRPLVGARFVIMFAKDTIEDPAARMERDGFLDEIERISEAAGVFDAERFDELDVFLAEPGPAVVPEPERLDSYHDAFRRAVVAAGERPLDEAVAMIADTLGVEPLYAYVSFALPDDHDPLAQAARRLLEPRLPQPEPEVAPYLEVELMELPDIARPKVEPRRLSTGQAPLEIVEVGGAWQLRCTGCGEGSPLAHYRWQVFDLTVACRCA
jgi:hypothetical protein